MHKIVRGVKAGCLNQELASVSLWLVMKLFCPHHRWLEKQRVVFLGLTQSKPGTETTIAKHLWTSRQQLVIMFKSALPLA